MNCKKVIADLKKYECKNDCVTCVNMNYGCTWKEIEAAIETIEEQERQLKEYHKFDSFLASHGMFEVSELQTVENAVEENNETENKKDDKYMLRKICPVTFLPNAMCMGNRCMWWSEFAQDCSVPIIACILADSTICQNYWE